MSMKTHKNPGEMRRKYSVYAVLLGLQIQHVTAPVGIQQSYATGSTLFAG